MLDLPLAGVIALGAIGLAAVVLFAFAVFVRFGGPDEDAPE